MRKPKTVRYEQCPWNKRHVASLYSSEIPLVEDGNWHAVQTGRARVGFSRVTNGFFQLVRGNSRYPLLEQCLALDPMETEDDAEWEITPFNDGYVVHTAFSPTFGPCDAQERLSEHLEPYGLWLENNSESALAVAYIAKIESSVLLEATRRLVWLENYCMSANRSIYAELDRLWGSLADQVEGQISSGSPVDFMDLSVLPKKRKPLAPGEEIGTWLPSEKTGPGRRVLIPSQRVGPGLPPFPNGQNQN